MRFESFEWFERKRRPQGARGGRRAATWMLLAAWMGVTATACAPRVKIDAPEEPIVINLNIKIDHELRVKVDDEIDDLFDENSELFGSDAAEGATQ